MEEKADCPSSTASGPFVMPLNGFGISTRAWFRGCRLRCVFGQEVDFLGFRSAFSVLFSFIR